MIVTGNFYYRSTERPSLCDSSHQAVEGKDRQVAMFCLSNHPHRRYNPLSREWVTVSPHRTQRPWQGQVEQPTPDQRPTYDPKCYLCPGNERAGGVRNPQYEHTFVFTNDFTFV
jgi:galactose-1-phosphate uridylyltransferase (family 1)